MSSAIREASVTLSNSSAEKCDSARLPDWLPEGKLGAVCFSVDDVHPAPEIHAGNGNRNQGPLAHLQWLLERHEQLRATLFTTPDWRQTSPVPTRRMLSRTPFLRHRFNLAPTLPAGVMLLTRHPGFVARLKELPRVEIGLHGLNHVQRGPSSTVEFAGLSQAECKRLLQESMAMFAAAGLEHVPGMTPPGWEVTDNLARAMVEVGLQFVASARDIRMPVTANAVSKMSGLKNASLIYPELICHGRLLHITTNFQATNSIDRALEIIRYRGLVAIKAHSLKYASGHVALDGLDELYRSYLDVVFTRLEREYGSALWWTSMGEISDRCMTRSGTQDSVG